MTPRIIPPVQFDRELRRMARKITRLVCSDGRVVVGVDVRTTKPKVAKEALVKKENQT